MFSGPTMTTRNVNELRYCCPYCTDTGFHLYYNTRKNLYHCFKCGARGVGVREVSLNEEKLKEIKDIIVNGIDVSLATHSLILPSSRFVNETPDNPMSRWVIKYLVGRGLSLYDIHDLDCMWSDDKRYKDRVIIPVKNGKGEIIYYQARGLLNMIKPKYINPIQPKGGVVYWNSFDHPNTHDPIYITEGIFKAIRFKQVGLIACGVFGKEITSTQMHSIAVRSRGKVYIMLDPDAFPFAIDMRDKIKTYYPEIEVRVIRSEVAPDDMSPKELSCTVRRAG